MSWDVAEPGDAGGFEGDVGVKAAGDGAVDDGLLLLVEQGDQLPLRPNRPLNPPARVVEKRTMASCSSGNGIGTRWSANAS